MAERRKIVDWEFVAMGQGKDPKTKEGIPGFIGLRIEFSDGTRFANVSFTAKIAKSSSSMMHPIRISQKR